MGSRKVLIEINEARFDKGMPFLVPRVRPYSEDKPDLKTMQEQGQTDFEYQQIRQYYYLAHQATDSGRKEIVSHFNKSMPSQRIQDEVAKDMGEWFADYTQDSGYFLDGGHAMLMKQMIMIAFPPLNKDGEITEENLEATTLRMAKLMNDYFKRDEPA